MNYHVESAAAMKQFGEAIGRAVQGGEILELIGDVGAGKTTLTKGIAIGMGIIDDVQSPTFTISRLYQADRELSLAHYDFYRLSDAGIMAIELAEALDNPRGVTIIEWGEIVKGVLPADRVTMRIEADGEDARLVTMTAHGDASRALLKTLKLRGFGA